MTSIGTSVFAVALVPLRIRNRVDFVAELVGVADESQ
jgi:hypothetical protein